MNHLFQYLLIERNFTTTPCCLSTIHSYFHCSFPSLTCTHLSGYLVMSLELVRHGIIHCIFHHDIHTSARLHDSEAIPTHARRSLIDVSDALCILFPQVWPAMVRNSPQWHLENPFSLVFSFFSPFSMEVFGLLTWRTQRRRALCFPNPSKVIGSKSLRISLSI